MKKIKRFLLIFVFIVALGAIFITSGCSKKKIHKYSDKISTTNISSIEYKIDLEHKYDRSYDESYYRTLTEDEQTKFINSINNDDLKYEYWGKPSEYKGIYYNTFIIHYNDGSKTNLDEHHIEIIDKDGNVTYCEIVFPYGDSKIEENLFK